MLVRRGSLRVGGSKEVAVQIDLEVNDFFENPQRPLLISLPEDNPQIERWIDSQEPQLCRVRLDSKTIRQFMAVPRNYGCGTRLFGLKSVQLH